MEEVRGVVSPPFPDLEDAVVGRVEGGRPAAPADAEVGLGFGGAFCNAKRLKAASADFRSAERGERVLREI